MILILKSPGNGKHASSALNEELLGFSALCVRLDTGRIASFPRT
jgi:hypothetical protein